MHGKEFGSIPLTGALMRSVRAKKKHALKFSRKHPEMVERIQEIMFNGMKEDASEEEILDAIVELLRENNLKLPIDVFEFL